MRGGIGLVEDDGVVGDDDDERGCSDGIDAKDEVALMVSLLLL